MLRLLECIDHAMCWPTYKEMPHRVRLMGKNGFVEEMRSYQSEVGVGNSLPGGGSLYDAEMPLLLDSRDFGGVLRDTHEANR